MGKPSQDVMDFMSKYKIDSDEIWEVHGATWVVKHKALERVAVEVGIIWLRPEVITCDLTAKIAVICAYGKIGDREEWSFGEAAPANNKNSYPMAMAEKRARDRVILKLLVSHGALYSESEADEFASSNSAGSGPAKRTELPKKDAKPVYLKLQAEIQASVSRDQLKEWGKANTDRIEVLPEDWRDILRMQYEEQMADLRQREAA
jgi:hypothetical protein